MKNRRIDKPSEYYRMRRPEYFSDSETIYDVTLTKEQFAFELSQITTNQKQDEFETLCRKLVEKLITPNLIPQVGPTGGGDGKTDSETYPVSSKISDRWFVPENGWTNDEKWAFAFSAKETWKSKAESDIKKIISTKREYTRIYFITNQTPSSKKKKDAQDEFIKKYKVDIILLDGTWILEKVYDNKLFDIVVDSLNLSTVYKAKKIVVGQNDASRIKKLKEIEENIQNPNRYFEYDFQLVEDALESAILSRKLEKSRDEIEGKFDRAFRLCKKLNLNKQWIRLHYQRAWTDLFYFDDFSAFIEEFKEFKKYISKQSSISEIELYVNLFNGIRGFGVENYKLEEFQVDLSKEKEDLYKILDEIKVLRNKPCSSLIAKLYKSIQELMDSFEEKNSDKYLIEISRYFTESIGLIDFPFDTFKKLVEEFGIIFPNNIEYDNLIDVIASIEEKRSSELSAGYTFLKRGIQKNDAKYYKESIVYFGKAIMKLAKEESREGLYITLKGLGFAYSKIGLIWASNNCFISASSISFKSWYESGILDNKVYDCVKQLVSNELHIGRIPVFLVWHELLQVVSMQIEVNEDPDEIPIFELLDACLSVRILNTESKEDVLFTNLPDLFENQNLWLSQNASFFKLGYIDTILDDYKNINIKTDTDLANHFEMVAKQPFRNQMLYKTNFLSGNKIQITSKILGCEFNFIFTKDIELLLVAETFAAFFESFLATSLTNVYPNTESIDIVLVRNVNEKLFQFSTKESSSEYEISINKLDFPIELQNSLNMKMMEFTSNILATNFFLNNIEDHLENLFRNEKLTERLALIFEHRNFTLNVLGNNPKLFFEDWNKSKSIKQYPIKRVIPLSYKFDNRIDPDKINSKLNFDEVGHDKRKVISIIDDKLWNKAKWQGFGAFYDPNEFGFGAFIGYENGDAGKEIFEGWIKRVGKEDNENLIRLTIIKGISKQNPSWYKVHITSNIQKDILESPERLINVMARFHKMTPINSKNLDILESGIKRFKKIRLCPAMISIDASQVEPYFNQSIILNSIEIKNAWEIGLHDIESSAILKDDSPIIPDGINNAPVLELLKKRKTEID